MAVQLVRVWVAVEVHRHCEMVLPVAVFRGVDRPSVCREQGMASSTVYSQDGGRAAWVLRDSPVVAYEFQERLAEVVGFGGVYVVI